jgi:hypothetical protein
MLDQSFDLGLQLLNNRKVYTEKFLKILLHNKFETFQPRRTDERKTDGKERENGKRTR